MEPYLPHCKITAIISINQRVALCGWTRPGKEIKPVKDEHSAQKALGCDTHSSASGTSHGWGSDTDRESHASCCGGLYQLIHHDRAVAVCTLLQPDASCRLTLRFPAFSHQLPGSAPHISQRLPPPCWALPFLPALSLLRKPSQPKAL